MAKRKTPTRAWRTWTRRSGARALMPPAGLEKRAQAMMAQMGGKH